MNVFFATLLLALTQTSSFTFPRLEQSAPLEQSLSTIGTSWVVLNLKTGSLGNIQSVEVLQGVSPFLEIALGNVRQWMFTPAGTTLPAETHVTVVFLFRPRDLFSGAPLLSSQSFTNSDRPPVPLELPDPGYPVSSVAEGIAILEFRVAPAGTIENVRVVTDSPDLAAYTERAVRGWKFRPAMRNGVAVTGTVIVVASYLRPMIYNNPPAIGSPYYPYSPGNSGGPVVNPAPGATFRDGKSAPPPEFRSR